MEAAANAKFFYNFLFFVSFAAPRYSHFAPSEIKSAIAAFICVHRRRIALLCDAFLRSLLSARIRAIVSR